MVAYADLGGLGTKQGAPVFYAWTMPSLMPQFLPWLAILALLMLKRNRCASAWWVWVPVACIAGLACAPQSLLELLPSSGLDVLLELVGGLGFGLAAVWLLAGYLGGIHRMLAFLGILLAQGLFGLVCFFLRRGWEGVGSETFVVGICLAVSILVLSVALTLAGLACRGRYGWLRLTLWLIVALLVVWPLVITPFFILGRITAGNNVPLVALLMVVLVATGISFGSLLPFLVLSFVNGFYRERLKALLHLGGATPPPVVASPPVMAEVAGG